MALTSIQRESMIRSAIGNNPESAVADAIDLWQNLADELISLIGSNGFDSLFARSLHIVSATYPCLMVRRPPSRAADTRFAELRAGLDQCSHDEAIEANVALTTIFLNILTLLIGDPLTASILRSAWGDDAFNRAGKEPPP